MKPNQKEYISQLLDKFMNGTTTLDEEDVLSRYFAQHDLPTEWESYRQLFQELEAMKPQRRTHRHWLRWSAAAAVAALVLFAVTVSQQTELSALTAQADSITVLHPEAPNEQPLPDTSALRRLKQQQDAKPKRRRLRKPQPTMTDIDKAYGLMAKVQEEHRQAEQQVAQVQQEILQAQLTAAGYTPITLEDGTIIYIDEPNEYFAYEE